MTITMMTTNSVNTTYYCHNVSRARILLNNINCFCNPDEMTVIIINHGTVLKVLPSASADVMYIDVIIVILVGGENVHRDPSGFELWNLSGFVRL